ncbi:MAG: type VI secretion protein IcmF/TssM N-terminal domain-containing protein, partial [Verrucomicrobiota bacterium]
MPWLVIVTTVLFLAFYFFPRRVAFLSVTALILGGVIYLLVRRARRKKAEKMGEELLSMARKSGFRQDIRLKFREAIQRFREDGVKLHVLPWYLVVGEPNAGKSELIRRSELKFMTREFEDLPGMGGTIDMNWWFSNHAIFLDLAGKLTREEGTNTEGGVKWLECLNLLQKYRPTCPFNGMILVVPAQYLLDDPELKLSRLSRTFRNHLRMLHQKMDLKFPVTVIISKCDLIPGFDPFFAHIPEEERRQVFGWSSGQPLDAPFKTELFETYMDEMYERLDGRLLNLIQNPNAGSELGTRLTEV